VQWLGTRKGAVKLRPDHKLSVVRDLTVADRVKTADEILGHLVRVAAQAKAA